jgi:hypothetical protein
MQLFNKIVVFPKNVKNLVDGVSVSLLFSDNVKYFTVEQF